jgi:hypothetical protein
MAMKNRWPLTVHPCQILGRKGFKRLPISKMPRVKVQQSGKRSFLQAFFVHETARVLAFVAGEAILTQANACPFLFDRVFPCESGRFGSPGLPTRRRKRIFRGLIAPSAADRHPKF